MIGTFVFINMATDDIAAARDFYTKLGFEINEMFSNDQNIFVIIAQNVQLILGARNSLGSLANSVLLLTRRYQLRLLWLYLHIALKK